MQTKKIPTYLGVLMAGLLAAGAQAQSAGASASTNGPPKAGEASTQTMGVPNAKTTNSMASETPAADKDTLRQDAQGRDSAAATTSVPGKAGESSAMVQGKPNTDPKASVHARSRAEVRAELLASRRNFEDTKRILKSSGARSDMTGAATATTATQ